MNRFILAAALALMGGSAQAQSYYYDPGTNTYYQYSPGVVQAGNVVVSPGYVTTASYAAPATTYYYPNSGYYYPNTYYGNAYGYSNSYGRGYSNYYGANTFNGWANYARRGGWRR